MNLEILKCYFRIFRSVRKDLQERKNSRYEYERIAAELIRNTHSIEKGLSIENPRLGFGHNKHILMMEEIKILSTHNSSYYNEVCIMALDSLREYYDYHKRNDFQCKYMDELKEFLQKYVELKSSVKMGGTTIINKKELEFNIPSIEFFFNTRHSIRDYDTSDIDKKRLKRALILAQKAPSACNRQGFRVYVLESEKKREVLEKELEGIGGFAEQVKKYILITGKASAYRIDESYQYIVSASMYAAYLTLTLHLYGMGACVIQRSLIWTKRWEEDRKQFGISEDEQIVCILAVGNLKDSCSVPTSHRVDAEEMIKFL